MSSSSSLVVSSVHSSREKKNSRIFYLNFEHLNLKEKNTRSSFSVYVVHSCMSCMYVHVCMYMYVYSIHSTRVRST